MFDPKYTRYFWQLNVQGQFKVILCISNFRQPCISKTARCRAKRASSGKYSMYTGSFWQLNV